LLLSPLRSSHFSLINSRGLLQQGSSGACFAELHGLGYWVAGVRDGGELQLGWRRREVDHGGAGHGLKKTGVGTVMGTRRLGRCGLGRSLLSYLSFYFAGPFPYVFRSGLDRDARPALAFKAAASIGGAACGLEGGRSFVAVRFGKAWTAFFSSPISHLFLSFYLQRRALIVEGHEMTWRVLLQGQR
jgi:hypothetical protein